MPTADPTLALLARLVDHERWTLARPDHNPIQSSIPVVNKVGRMHRYIMDGILWRWHAGLRNRTMLPEGYTKGGKGGWLPDPDDHATGGVLASLLPEGWQATRWPDGSWTVWHRDHEREGDAPTLGRACVPAIASAWGVE